LLLFLISACASGVGSPAQLVCDNVYEADFDAYSGSSPTGSASDVLLTLDSSYASTVGSISDYTAAQTAYQQAWNAFLGGTPVIVFNSGGSGSGVLSGVVF
jgi:hypothetical protein